MPDKKLTDNEIIKALECCKYEYDTKCELCCYNFYSRTGCRSELRRNALDLINRLQATIDSFTDIGKLYSEIKAEAYKECIEKVKEIIPAIDDTYIESMVEECLDNLLKELVGEDNASKT